LERGQNRVFEGGLVYDLGDWEDFWNGEIGDAIF
jgi:hypothetical protein